jgi:HD-GYP domain-containing protein (c-di-GMP phosphodiesterase class II)
LEAPLVFTHEELVRRTSTEASRPAETRPSVAGHNGRALLRAVQSHDGPTAAHSSVVLDLARRVARRLGLPPGHVAEVEQVALLHDVGKLSVPQAILSKPGPLDDAERATVRSHPAIGAAAVSEVSELAHLAPAVRASHERWDGRGYPDGLAGYDIPIASRITFVCDAYDAMTSDRAYRMARSQRLALAELLGGAGTQFCPHCAEALVDELLEGS